MKPTILAIACSGFSVLATYAYLTDAKVCRTVVIRDMEESNQFAGKMAELAGAEDFLTTLSRGK